MVQRRGSIKVGNVYPPFVLGPVTAPSSAFRVAFDPGDGGGGCIEKLIGYR
jgi:hypothetical protein